MFPPPPPLSPPQNLLAPLPAAKEFIRGNLPIALRWFLLHTPAGAGSSIANGAPNRPGIQPALEQLLSQLALGREPQEQPRERGDRHQRALDHHHRPGERLVVEGRDSPARVGLDVIRVEDRARPEKDVAERCLEHADDRDVAKLEAGAEPLWPGQRLDD